MTGPDMATITASLERDLQNCSLNSRSTSNGRGVRFSSSSSSDSQENHLSNSSVAGLDLNSQISLPYQWEQCLDLKTGEIYYINWRTGMKAKEDPRTTGDFYSEDEDEDEDVDDDDNDDSSYDDSEESSSESSPSSSRDQINGQNNRRGDKKGNVLVVAGCKSCLMYFMVPKQDAVCPKCCGQLLHFDQSDNGSL